MGANQSHTVEAKWREAAAKEATLTRHNPDQGQIGTMKSSHSNGQGITQFSLIEYRMYILYVIDRTVSVNDRIIYLDSMTASSVIKIFYFYLNNLFLSFEVK